VFNASIQELMDVPGIGENAALLIRLMPQMAKKRELSKVKEMTEFCRSSQVAKFLMPRFIDERDEVAMVVCLDTQNCMLCCEVLNHGDVKSVDISVRRLVETALKHKASAVVLAHNHPDGALMPSLEDERFTTRARDALKLLDIKMMDHIIIAGNRYFSMKDSSMFGRF
jgi:DNA repair protein RadC